MTLFRPLNLFLLAAIALMCISQAKADMWPYPVKKFRMLVVCAHAVDCPRVIRLQKAASQYILQAVNVDIQVVGYTTIHEDMSGDPDERLRKWFFRTIALRDKIKPDFTMVFVSAFPITIDAIDFEAERTYGVVNLLCGIGDPNAIGYLRMAGSDKVITRVLLHEVGHLLGARHTPTGGIMFPDVAQVQYADQYSVQSIQEITACIRSKM